MTPTILSVLYKYCQLSTAAGPGQLPVIERNGYEIGLPSNETTYSAREQTRNWHLKLTHVRLQPWSLMVLGEVLCIKDHVCSRINDFRVRIRAITNVNPSCVVDSSN